MTFPKVAWLVLIASLVFVLAGCSSAGEPLLQAPTAKRNYEALGEPLEVNLSIDAGGRAVTVPAFARTLRMGLGPVSVETGIEDAVRLAEGRGYRYNLFVVWRDEAGNAWLDQYVIGRNFHIQQDGPEQAREVALENDNVIIAVDNKGDLATAPPVLMGPQRPSATPSPVSPPSPTEMVPSPSPTVAPSPAMGSPAPVACAGEPGPSFARLWDGERLGCALGAENGVTTAYEAFENGWMLWRSDDLGHYVFYNGGFYETFTYPAAEPANFACPEAEALGRPRRGFSRVWCENPEVRTVIGNATEDEIGDTRPLQEFANGFMIYVRERGTVVTVHADGSWTEQP